MSATTEATYVVTVRVSAWQGSPMAAAIYQGYGEDWLKSYLRTKMPAGSPVEIATVTEVKTSRVAA